MKKNRADKARRGKSALKIQKMVRTRQAKNALKKKMQSRDDESAAKMQSLFRAKKGREDAEQKKHAMQDAETRRKKMLRTVELKVDVIGAAGLAKADLGSLSDPFVLVYWGDKLVHTTKVINDTLNPSWGDGETVKVEFECMDEPIPLSVHALPLDLVKKKRVKLEIALDEEMMFMKKTKEDLETGLKETTTKMQNSTNSRLAKSVERENLEEWNGSRKAELTREIEGLIVVGGKFGMLEVSFAERLGMFNSVIGDKCNSMREELIIIMAEQKRLEKLLRALEGERKLWDSCRVRMLVEKGYEIPEEKEESKAEEAADVDADADAEEEIEVLTTKREAANLADDLLAAHAAVPCNFVAADVVPELRVELYDWDAGGSKDFMGTVTLQGMKLLQAAAWGEEEKDRVVAESKAEEAADEDENKNEIENENKNENKNEKATGNTYQLLGKPMVGNKSKSINALVKGTITFNTTLTKRVRLMQDHDTDPQDLLADVQVAGMSVSYITYSAVMGVIDIICQKVRKAVLARPLILRVVDAHGLRKADLFGLSDPFGVVCYEGEDVGKTNVVKDSLNPFWGSNAGDSKKDKSVFMLKPAMTNDPELNIDVFDWDLMEGDEDFLGKVRLDFDTLHRIRRECALASRACVANPGTPEYFKSVRQVIKLLTREEAGLPPVNGTEVTVKIHGCRGLAQADR